MTQIILLLLHPLNYLRIKYNNFIDWRTPEEALELDLILVEDIFQRLNKSSNKALANRKQNLHTRCFPKAIILDEIEKSHFHEKRPVIRALHAHLSCPSFEKEVQNMEDFLHYRLRKNTLSITIVSNLLRKLYHNIQAAKDHSAQVKNKKILRHNNSTWCVRNSKLRNLSQFYKVHDLSTTPAVMRQQKVAKDQELAVIFQHTNTLVQYYIHTAISNILTADVLNPNTITCREENEIPDAIIAPTKLQNEIKTEAPSRQLSMYARELKRRATERARIHNDHAAMQNYKLKLQMAILCVHSNTPSISSSCSSSRISDVNTSETLSTSAEATTTELALALAESQGDHKFAIRLLQKDKISTGFKSAIKDWETTGRETQYDMRLFKCWKTVYRSSVMQSIQGDVVIN